MIKRRGAGGVERCERTGISLEYTFLSPFSSLLILYVCDRRVRFSEVSVRSRCRFSKTTAGRTAACLLERCRA